MMIYHRVLTDVKQGALVPFWWGPYNYPMSAVQLFCLPSKHSDILRSLGCPCVQSQVCLSVCLTALRKTTKGDNSVP